MLTPMLIISGKLVPCCSVRPNPRTAPDAQLPQALRATICSTQRRGRRANSPSGLKQCATLSVRCAAPRPRRLRASRLRQTSVRGDAGIRAWGLGLRKEHQFQSRMSLSPDGCCRSRLILVCNSLIWTGKVKRYTIKSSQSSSIRVAACSSVSFSKSKCAPKFPP